MIHTKLHLHYTSIWGKLFFLRVIVLGNKADETSISGSTYSWVACPNVLGEFISVKIAPKTADSYRKTFW